MRARVLSAVLVIFASVPAFAAIQSETVVRELPIDPAGTVWISNPYGSIDVVGTEEDKVIVSATRIINATDEATLNALKDAIAVTFEGDVRTRVVNSAFPARDRRWTAIVNFTVRVPRSVSVKIAGHAMDHVRVSQIAGSVTVKTFSGTIILSGIAGQAMVDTVNGRVIFDYPERPAANARVQAVNADVDIYVPRDAAFDWVAETLRGDLLTTVDVKGLFTGNVYKGRTNGGGGPTLTTSSLAGKVSMLAKGTPPAQARSLLATSSRENGPQHLPSTKKVQIPFVYQGLWLFEANVADLNVGEIHGSARILTGAGEVEIGSVWGNLQVKSGGGPLKFGDLLSPVDVHTDAGDVTLRIARQGGNASTDGGIVRVMYAGGPMNLRSGGGDIIVQQTAGPIDAVTRSGDISITVAPTVKTQRLSAKTSQGNVALVVSPNFAADIDALLITDDSDAHNIQSDFNLTFRREAFNGKTRIRATGKINGGGERVELVAEDGSINISSQVIMPIVPAVPMRRQP